MDLTTLPPLIAAVATAVGLGRLLELLVTRRKLRGDSQKVEVDAAQVISAELRTWATEANNRARAAEERAVAIEARFQVRVDELLDKLDRAEHALDKLEGRILRCQAGPVCPVRTAETDPNLRPVRRPQS